MATSTQRFRLIGEDDASSAFLKVAAAARLTKSTMDDLGSSALGITKAVGGASMIPVLAGATAAVTELGTALGAAAGAAGIFGLSAGGFLAGMVKDQQSIATTQKQLDGLTKGTKDYHDALVKLHNKQAAFNKDYGAAAKGYNNMKRSFDGFLHATGPVTKGVLAKGFDLIASVLPKLVPVSNAAGHAIGGLIDDLSKWTKGPQFKALLHFFETSGPKAITRFGHAAGNIMSGLGGILSNFVKPGDKAAKTLERLTKNFDKWGHSKGVSDSVDKFLRYVNSNGGNITASLQALAEAAPKIAVALGKLGSANLSLTTKSLQLIASLPQGAFNAVADGLFGIYVASKALTIVQGLNTLFIGASTAMTAMKGACIGTRIALAALFVQEKVVAAGAKAMAAAQWLLNAAMAANPVVLVVAALAALAVGLVIAYKKSETFRNIVNAAFQGVAKVAGAVVGFIKDHWKALLIALTGPTGLAIVLIVKNFDKIKAVIQDIGAVGRWLWNNVFQPVFRFIANGIASLMDLWAKMLGALGHVPGFGWAKAAANALQNAADKAHGLADSIGKIPSSKRVDINIYTHHIGVHGQDNPDLVGMGGSRMGSGSGAGASRSAADGWRAAGRSLMDGLMKGIADRQLPLQTAMTRVQDLISRSKDKISNLMSTRSGFRGTFTADNLFGTDVSGTEGGPTGIAALIAAQKAQANQAKRLNRDVRKVTGMGLSKALVRQLESQGTSGAAALHALATGDPAQIALLNRLNRQTSDSLRSAGMRAGNYVRGGSIDDDIRRAKKQEHVLELLEHHLKDLADSQKKGQTIVVKIGDQAIIQAVHRYEHRKGKKPTGV